MKRKRINAAEIWKQMEDLAVPQLRLSVVDRAVYSLLLRHTHLEGTARISFSVPWLARAICLCAHSARRATRRLVAQGVLRLVSRTKAGHVVDVLLPDQILARRTGENGAESPHIAADVERADFMNDTRLRALIHAREGGACFYCLRHLDAAVRCLDHVVPQAKSGTNSYRNLVSACVECNSQKGERAAAHLLRQLYRERRLSSDELAGRLRALDALAAGKLRPPLPGAEGAARGRGRPPLRPERLSQRMVPGQEAISRLRRTLKMKRNGKRG